MKFESFFKCNVIETYTRVDFCLKNINFTAIFVAPLICPFFDDRVGLAVHAKWSKYALSTGQRWKMVHVSNFESTSLSPETPVTCFVPLVTLSVLTVKDNLVI